MNYYGPDPVPDYKREKKRVFDMYTRKIESICINISVSSIKKEDKEKLKKHLIEILSK